MDFLEIAKYFEKMKIDKLIITAYYYSDETNFLRPVYLRNGEEVASYVKEAKEYLTQEEINEFLYNFDPESFYYDEIEALNEDYGVFEVDFVNKTITRTNNAYMPDADVETEELEVEKVYSFNSSDNTWSTKNNDKVFVCEIFDYDWRPPNKAVWLDKWMSGYMEESFQSISLDKCIRFLKYRFVGDSAIKVNKPCRVVRNGSVVWQYDPKTQVEEQVNFPFYIKWADAFKEDETGNFAYIPFNDANFSYFVSGTNNKLVFNFSVDAYDFLDFLKSANPMVNLHFKIEDVSGNVLEEFEAAKDRFYTSIAFKSVSLPLITQDSFINLGVRYSSSSYHLESLTEEEILDAAEAIQELRNWRKAVAFAKKWYGEQAYKIVVETSSEYNDEGGYDDVVAGVYVYDKDEKLLNENFLTQEIVDEYLQHQYKKHLESHEYRLKTYGRTDKYWFECEPSVDNPSFATWFEETALEMMDDERYHLNAEDIEYFVDTPPQSDDVVSHKHIFGLTKDQDVREYVSKDLIKETYDFLISGHIFQNENGVIRRNT